MPQQNASLSWIVTLVVFAFFVGVLVGVLLMNSLNPPGNPQVAHPQAAPTTSQQTVSQVSGVAQLPAPPQVDVGVSALLAGYSASIDKVNQAVARLIERVTELNNTLRRSADAKIQLARAEAQAQTILAQADLYNQQQQNALATAAREQAGRDAERAVLTITLATMTLEVFTAAVIGALCLILAVVWRRLRQRPPLPMRQSAPRVDQAYRLEQRRQAQANERAERRRRLRQNAGASRPYHDLPLAIMDDEA